MHRDHSVLLVEDEALFSLQMADSLRAIGYRQIAHAASADEALLQIEEFQPDIAILDVQIEGSVDGIELAHTLTYHRDIPIIFLTGSSDKSTLERAIETEPYAFLVKPIDCEMLDNAIEIAVNKHTLQKERKIFAKKMQQLELKLLDVQKLDAIGNLTAGIAHELNNSLTAIMGNICLARASLDASSETHATLAGALQCCDRSATLIKQLLCFAKKSASVPECLPLSATIYDFSERLKPALKPSTRIEIHPDDNRIQVNVDRKEFQQAFNHLILNAEESMPDCGSITIDFSEAYVAEPEEYNTDARPGVFSTMTVKDSGVGIPTQHLHRIFEPFFSTKGREVASGLGLSVVHGIVQHHGGWVQASSKVNSGTCFTVYLPAAHAISERMRSVLGYT